MSTGARLMSSHQPILAAFSDTTKHWLDGGAVVTVFGTLFSVLPQFTALLAAIWFALRIFETWQRTKINKQEMMLNARKLDQ